MTRCFLIILMAVTCVHGGYAQVDTEFWFAPPEVTSGHGDNPIYLRLSTLDKDAVITVVQPGRDNFLLGTANVSANTTHTMDLTPHIGILETIEAASVMKTGIRITSTAPITAYYEVGATWNSDIFPLKGANALGNKFVIPAQDFYNNGPDYFPRPSSSFDIVASKNNTIVKVRPTKPLIGHLSDTVITIKLNAGETYSFRKSTLSALDNPGGTIVESNKPIAITIKDDSVINGTCRDVLGDQLVPVAVAGKEYVVLKGFLSTNEFLFITATEDDTKVFLYGEPTPVATLSAGQVFRHPVTRQSTYIEATKTIYVFHVTGFGCEIGLAILPSINCRGSQQIGFSRTTNEFFGLNILVRKEGVTGFRLNGSQTLIPAAVFNPVPGTNDEWYSGQLSFSTTQMPVGSGSLISNTINSFQIGIINGGAGSTCRYGYFSSFSTLFIGDDLDFCEGEVATLDGGPEKESYLWSTGETTQKIQISTPGTYWVKAEREECVLYDTIKVDVKKGHLDLGPDREVCRGDMAGIDGKENFSWLWSDGSTGQFLNTKLGGKYWLSVFDNTGCVASDTILISLKDVPSVNLGADILKCKTETAILNASFPGATYTWNDGNSSASRIVTEAGLYSVKLSWNGCFARDSILVENLPGPLQDSIFGSPSICPFASDIDYEVHPIPGSVYQWFVKGGSIKTNAAHGITVDWLDTNPSASVKVLITDAQGCKRDTIFYPVKINVTLIAEIPIGPDTLCVNKSQQIVYMTPKTNGSDYQWNIIGGAITQGQGSHEVTINWLEGLNKLWIDETAVTIDTVCHGISEALSVYVFKDQADIELNYVSVDTSRINLINVSWGVAHSATVLDNQVMLYKKTPVTADWELLASLPVTTESFDDNSNFRIEGVYQYQLSMTNLCDEFIATNVHATMYLTGEADTTTESITLRWNLYQGWVSGVDYYEVWRKMDDDAGYRYVSTVAGNENVFTATLAADGFEHQYVIRAIEKSGSNESWSSQLNFAFEHNLIIPNIITPNGDEFNQYFDISKVELYKNSELTITDRWGKKVHHVTNYQNDWDGDGLSTGVYFYVLDLRKNGKIYKGLISILK